MIFASYSERAYRDHYNPTPDHAWHCAARDEHLRLKRIRQEVERMASRARREWDKLPDALSPTAEARAHLASLSPERRALLNAEWDDALLADSRRVG